MDSWKNCDFSSSVWSKNQHVARRRFKPENGQVRITKLVDWDTMEIEKEKNGGKTNTLFHLCLVMSISKIFVYQ